jgi:hypothetical protein
VVLGITFALLGMALFTTGIELGLAPLGRQAGTHLPAAFQPIPLVEHADTIPRFDTTLVQTAVDSEGNRHRFFHALSPQGYRSVPFEAAAFDTARHSYAYTPVHGPLFSRMWGMVVVLLFAFVMGYGATLAEPALNALGRTVEELTVGSLRRTALVQTVAVGVGIGMAFGVAKILWNIPLLVLLIPPYIVALVITALSSEDYVNIAWDSAGVTTGPITVPLVLALGLGVGGQMGVVEGFGILAMASVWPILAVLTVGLLSSRSTGYPRQESATQTTVEDLA